MNKKVKVNYTDSVHGEQSVTFGAKNRQDVERQLKLIANNPTISKIEWLE